MATRTRTRLVAIVILVAMVALIGVTVSRATPPPPSLPSVSADRLLASSLRALTGPFSIAGDVRTDADLGLPELPSGLAGPSSLASSLLGTQRFKVWRSPQGVRVAHLLDLAEQTFVADGTDAWWWDSSTMRAVHLRAPHRPRATGAPEVVPAVGNPLALASRALRDLSPYATIAVDGTARVAGRPVYRLVLAPRSSATLIGSIAVSIDATTRLPLGLEVTPKGGSSPAMDAAFTSVSFGSIDPALFTFTPPDGATVVTPALRRAGDPRTSPTHRVFGSAFDTVVATELQGAEPATLRALLPYRGPLASAILVRRAGSTWLLAGFVGLSTLREDASHLT